MISNSSALSEFGTGNEILPVLDDVEKGRLWDWFRPRRVESIEKALQQLVVLLVVPIGENWREVKCRRLISISTNPRRRSMSSSSNRNELGPPIVYSSSQVTSVLLASSLGRMLKGLRKPSTYWPDVGGGGRRVKSSDESREMKGKELFFSHRYSDHESSRCLPVGP